MSLINNKTNKQIIAVVLCAGSIATGLVFSGIANLSKAKEALAATPNTANLIVGQVVNNSIINGPTVELSLCIKTDTPNVIHITDATTIFQYTTGALTPSPTILATGNYSGGASYAPLKWQNAIGTTDKWSMDITYTGGTGTQVSYTPELIGKVQFAKSGTGTISLFSQEFFTTENINNPLTNTVINYDGLCTNYGTVVTTPTLGTAPTTAITGTVGSSLPTITVTGSNLAANTPATFTPAGGTAIAGFITNGVFTPTAPATISSGSLTGARSGVLAVTTPTGVTPLNIPTNFSAVAVPNPVVGTVLATSANPIVGVIGSSFGTISLSGNTFADNTPASFIPEGTTVVITGRILGGNFVAFANQPIPSGTLTGNRMGVLKINGINLNVPTNFSAAAVPPPATQPGKGAVITITNNSSSSISSTISSSSETKSETTPPPVQANIDNSGDDTIVLPKTGGVRKDTVQLESESLPRTGGNNQIILAILSIVSAVTFFAVYQSVHKRKILNFDKETKVK